MSSLFYSDTPWLGAVVFALFGAAAAGLVWLLARIIRRWNGEGFDRTAEGKIVRGLAIIGVTGCVLAGIFGFTVVLANADYLRGEYHRSLQHHASTARYLETYAAAVESGSVLKLFFLRNIVKVPLRDIHMAVASAYFAIEEYEKGFESLKLACGPGAGEDIAYEAFANQIEAQGRYKLAAECYEKLARRKTNDSEVAYRAAFCYYRLGDREKAKEWARMSLARSGKPNASVLEIEEVFKRMEEEAKKPR